MIKEINAPLQSPLLMFSVLIDSIADVNFPISIPSFVNDFTFEIPISDSSNIEFDLAKPSYTVFTLQVLKEKYPNHVFSLIMGEDNIRTLHKWKNFEYILENHEIYIYPRVQASQELDSIVKDDDNGFLNKDNVHICDAPLMNISSSFIRKAIKDNNDVRYI